MRCDARVDAVDEQPGVADRTVIRDPLMVATSAVYGRVRTNTAVRPPGVHVA
jgi:hypothetical protein